MRPWWMAAAVAGSMLVLPYAQSRSEPFVPIGVWYGGGQVEPPALPVDPAAARVEWRRDLQNIRAAGFNSITTWVSWAGSEPVPGELRLAAADQMLELAEEFELQVIVQVYADEPPAWAKGCADLEQFLAAIMVRWRPHAAFHRVEIWRGPPFPGCTQSPLADRYRALTPKPSAVDPWPLWRAPMAFDMMRSIAGSRPWPLSRLQGGLTGPAGSAVTASDLRLWGWAAIARGASTIQYDRWHGDVYRMTTIRGEVSERARVAGEFAGTVGRNARLFTALRPRPSRIAVELDPAAPIGDDTSAAGFYRAMFARNIQVDFLRPEDLPFVMSRYAYVYRAGGRADAAVDHALKLAVPEARVEGSPPGIEVRWLESPNAILLIAMNHAEAAQRATMTFARDTPEAIWVNLETGASVSFVVTADGPSLTHTFAARDVMVLVRGKRLR